MVLDEILNRLKAVLKNKCKTIRLYSDKFLVVCKNQEKKKKEKEAKEIVEAILRAFQKPFKINENEQYLTVNIGVAFYPEHGKSVISKAEIAQKEAYKQGTPYLFYNNSIIKNAQKVIQVLNIIKRDIENQQINISLQPKIDLNTGNIIGAECLMRASVPPSEAIPVICEYGLIFDVGKIVLEKAISVHKEIRKLNKNLTLSVNISFLQLIDKRFYPLVRRLFESNDIDASKFIFEITETEANIENPLALETLERLRNMGIKLSIDDFGSGYSSLIRLKLLKAHELKIDRIFIKNISNKEDQSIVKFIIDVGKLLSMTVVAEGIETKKQLEIVKNLNCDIGQGFFFSPPISKYEFLLMLEKLK